MGEHKIQSSEMTGAICGDKVRLGIEAPREASVHRREVWEYVRQQQTQRHPESLPRPIEIAEPRVQG